MTDDEFAPDEEALAERLRKDVPRPAPRLRRQVRERVALAFARRALRAPAAALVASGVALLATAAVIGLS